MATVTPVSQLRIDIPYDAVAEICRRYDVEELAVFGSVLTGAFGAASDVDFLVSFRGGDVGPWMGKLTEMEEELRQLLGRPVDLVAREAVERSENYIRREQILSTARVIYVA